MLFQTPCIVEFQAMIHNAVTVGLTFEATATDGWYTIEYTGGH